MWDIIIGGMGVVCALTAIAMDCILLADSYGLL